MPIVAPLVALDVLVLVLWCIAVALAIALVMTKISDVLAGVPWVGGKLSDAVQSMARKISSAAGALEGGIDHLIGGAWHQLSRYLDHLLRNFVAHSSVFLQLAHIVGRLVHANGALRALVHGVTGVAHGVNAAVRHLEREYHGIEHRVKALERAIGHGIGNDVRTAVKALERELSGIEKRVIPGLRDGIATAEADLSDLERWLGVKIGTKWLDWASALVLAGLGALGLGGLRCNSLLNSLSNRGCGLWNALEDLLGLFADAIIFADLCQLTAWINEVFSPIEGLVVGLISDAANAACAQPPGDFATFAASPGTLPPTQSLGTLP